MGSKSKVAIGDKFFLGMHKILCQAPIKRIKKIIADEKVVWEGNITENETISIDKPELFGGERKEGGVVGDVDIMLGDPSQEKNSYLIERLGDIQPAYKGVVSAVLKQCYLAALSPYIKQWSWEIEAIQGEDWYPETAGIDGANNPAHICYFVLTEVLRYPTSFIDDDSFREAADIFYNEGFGLSMLLSGGSGEKFLEEVTRHSHSLIDQDPETGLFFMLPLRGGNDISQTPVLNKSTISKLSSFSRPSSGDLVNEVTLKYRPQATDKEETITFHNLGAIQRQGKVVNQTVTYLGIDSHENAVAAANRDLPLLSTPLAKVKLTVSRSAATLKKGDIFRLTWQERGFNLTELPMRVTNINYGDLENREIVIDAVEDVFSATPVDYLVSQPSLFIDPVQPPQDPPRKRLVEIPFYDVALAQEQQSLNNFDEGSSFVGGLVAEEGYYISEWQFWTSVGSADFVERSTDLPCPVAVLSENINKTSLIAAIEQATDGIPFVKLNTYAYIGDEVIRVDALSTTSITIGRGCLDTVPQDHDAGTIIWFSEDFIAADQNEYQEGVTVSAHALPLSSGEVLRIAQSSPQSITMKGRYDKPYPPANVRIDNQYYPSSCASEPTISWSHRDKYQQLITPVPDWYDSDIGPERYSVAQVFDSSGQLQNISFDVAYNLRIYDTALNRLIVEERGVQSNNFSYPSDSIYYNDKRQPRMLGYPQCLIFQNAVSLGTINAPLENDPDNTARYLNPNFIYNKSYRFSYQEYTEHPRFLPLQDANFDTKAFEYNPREGNTSNSSTTGFEIPVDLRQAFNINLTSAIDLTTPGNEISAGFLVRFLADDGSDIFYVELGNEVVEGRATKNWEIRSWLRGQSLSKQTRIIEYGNSLSVSVSSQSDRAVSISGSYQDPIVYECPVMTVRKATISSSILIEKSGSGNVWASIEATHRLEPPLDYPLSLSGRQLRFELETVKLDNPSMQVFEHECTAQIPSPLSGNMNAVDQPDFTLISQTALTPHAFWRMTNISVPTGNSLEIAELEIADLSEQKPPIFIFSSPSPTLGGSQTDLHNNTLSNAPHYSSEQVAAGLIFTWDLSANPMAIRKVRQAGFDNELRYITGFTLEYSDDGTNWTTLNSVSGLTYPGDQSISDWYDLTP